MVMIPARISTPSMIEEGEHPPLQCTMMKSNHLRYLMNHNIGIEMSINGLTHITNHQELSINSTSITYNLIVEQIE